MICRRTLYFWVHILPISQGRDSLSISIGQVDAANEGNPSINNNDFSLVPVIQ